MLIIVVEIMLNHNKFYQEIIIDYGLFTPHLTALMLLNSKMYISLEKNRPCSCNRGLKFQKFLFLFTKADLLRLYFYTYDRYQVNQLTYV